MFYQFANVRQLRNFHLLPSDEDLTREEELKIHLSSVVNSDLVTRAIVFAQVPLGFRPVLHVPQNLNVNGDLLHGPTEELISADGIGWIPISRGFNVPPAVTLGTPIRELATRMSRLLRDAFLL